MQFELDHFFVLCKRGAPEGALLRAAGLIEGEPNTHPGQGTANRRFFFNNCMLELLWVQDTAEASKGAARRLYFLERVVERWASPFGFVFRPGNENPGVAPFPSWKYAPEYLYPPLHMLVGTNSDLLGEPICVYLPFVPAPKRLATPQRFITVTNVHVSIPSNKPSEVAKRVSEAKGLELTFGEDHLLQVEFDDCREGCCKDMRPDLPLILKW